MNSNKIIPFDLLEIKISSLRKQKKTIVLCHGCFDILHFGHAIHLNNAKKFGDTLIVSITKDKFIKKGVNRPIFSQEERAYLLSQLSPVNFVTINNNATSEDVISIVKPDIYVKGKEYSSMISNYNKKFDNEKRLVELYDGKVMFTKGKTSSSTLAINKLYDNSQV